MKDALAVAYIQMMEPGMDRYGSQGGGTVRYEINKPSSELTEGYFIIGLKYVTLFIIGWLVGWVFLLLVSSRRRNRGSGLGEILLEHSGITSIAIAIVVVWFFGQRAHKKYTLGLLTSIGFDDENEKVSLVMLNTMNGRHVTRTINYGDLRTSFTVTQDGLFGKQRVFGIHEKEFLVNRFNIDMTAWCRHERIDEVIRRLETFQGRPVP